MHCRTSGAEMHAFAGKQQIMGLVAAMHGDVTRRHGQHVFHQRAREPQASVIAEFGAGARHDLDARRWRIG